MITLTHEEMQKVEQYIKPYAIVPVDMQTTQLLINALRAKLSEPQRELAGLTIDEIFNIWRINHDDGGATDSFARAIEAKLKEKNAPYL